MADQTDRRATLTMTPSLQLAVRVLGIGGDELARLVEAEVARLGGAVRLGSVDEAPEPPSIADDGRPAAPVTRTVPTTARVVAATPDVVLMPDLRVAFYVPSAPVVICVDSKRKDAQWFARSMIQRGQTIARIGQALVDEDPDAFLSGLPPRRQPLKRVVERSAMHESMVMRVASYARMLSGGGGLVAFADVIAGPARSA